MSGFFEQGLEFEDQNDYENALRLYIQAAEQNHDMAECRIGHMYRFGRGVKKDYEKALYWYHRSAEKGNALAQASIGSIYRFGGQGVQKDYSIALEWYNLSAQQNNSFAQQNLGSMYRFGQGVRRDINKAIYWYSLAANQGNRFAQANLGTLYRLGEGVDIDYKQAYYWYSKSVEQDYPYAKYLLALLYYHGQGVEQNFTEAFLLLTEYAQDKTLDFKKNGEVFYYLGECYRNGFGTSMDLNVAKVCYIQAIEHNYNCDYALQIVKRELHEDSDRNLMREYAEYINSLNLPMKKLYDKVYKDLEKEFGTTWNKLSPASKRFLSSGMITYLSFCSLGEHIYGNLDFSSAIIQMFKALEKELGIYLYSKYTDFLKERQVSPNSFTSKRSFLKRISATDYNYKKSDDLSDFTCGNVSSTIGSDKSFEQLPEYENSFIKGTIGHIDRQMFEYLDSLFSVNAFSTSNRQTAIVDYVVSLSQEVKTISNDLRNPAAHNQPMKCHRAEVCGNYIIKVQKLLICFLQKIK